MQVRNQYKYILTDRFGTIEVAPLGEGDFTVSYEQEDDGKYFYGKQFQGKITFTGATFNRLRNIERSIYICTSQRLQVIRLCGNTESIIFDGYFKLTDGKWDLDKCMVTLKFEKSTPDKCLADNKNVKINLLQNIMNHITVKTTTPNGTIQQKNCFHSSPQPQSTDYWCDAGDPYAQNWTLVSYNVHSPDGTHHFVNNTWARELIELSAGQTPMPDWVLVPNPPNPTPNDVYARKITTYNCTYTNEPIDPDFGSYSDTMDCDILGYDGTSTTIDNGVLLKDVINIFVNTFCAGLQVVSDFFQINPQNPSNINYVTGLATQVNNLVLFQKSDVKRPTSYGNATKAEWTFEKLMETLATMFNVYYSVENGIFRLEHISWYSRAQGMDLTLPKYAKYVKGMRKYDYDIDNIPQKENWKFKEQYPYGLWQAQIDYTNACAIGGKDAEKNYVVDELMTDVQMCLNNPSSDSSVVEDAGFVMVATQVYGGVYYMITETQLNDSLSWSKLVPAYHYHNRPLKSGKFNGNNVTFYTTKPFKKGDKINVPIECGEVFNPNDKVLTALGSGIVDKAIYNLRTCMVELQLKYDVFDNLTNNAAPVFTSGTILSTYKNTPKIIPLNITDSDGIVVSVQVKNPPNNGTIQILSTTQALYTPNNNYMGWDYFTLVAFDDWSEVSNDANFGIEVLPANQPPVAGNDTYNVFHGYPFTSSPSIFANDSDDYGFTLITTNVTTTQGVSISIDPNTGNFSYTPPAGFEGNDTFTYTIQDNTGAQSTGTVTLVVGFKNKPIGVTDYYNTPKNTVLNVTGTGVGNEKLTANDYTPDGLTYTYTCNVENKATAQGGNVQIHADGTFVYTPPNNFVGQDSFTYTVNNVNGSGTGTAYIGVIPTVYVKLVSSNNQSHTKPKQNCGGGLVPAGFYTTRDFTFYFYQDAAGTIPLDVDSTWGLKINYRETWTYSGDCGNGSQNYDSQTGVVDGISYLLYDDFVVSDTDITCDGDQCNTSTTITLLAGGYIII